MRIVRILLSALLVITLCGILTSMKIKEEMKFENEKKISELKKNNLSKVPKGYKFLKTELKSYSHNVHYYTNQKDTIYSTVRF